MDNETTEVQEQQDLQAGFSAGFSGDALTEPTKAPEPPKEPEQKPATDAKDEAQAEQPGATETLPLTAEEITTLRAAAAAVPALRSQLDKAHGHIGTLTERVAELGKQKKTEAQTPAPTPAPEILTRIKAQYPELAEDLAQDLAEFAQSLPKGTDPEEAKRVIDDRVAEGVSAAAKEIRLERVREVHEDFDAVIESDGFKHWLGNTATDAQREIAARGAQPKPVIDLISAFKSHSEAAAKAKAKSQERLAGAITPEGEKRPTGKSTLSPDEAARKGYEEGFRS